MCDGVELLTRIQCSVNDGVNSNTELCGCNRIQCTCDPFVLPRYRVSSVAVRISEHIQIDGGH